MNLKRPAGTRCAIRVVAEVMTAPGGEREDGGRDGREGPPAAVELGRGEPRWQRIVQIVPGLS